MVGLDIDETFATDRQRMCSFTNKGRMMIAGGDRESTNKSRLFEVTNEAIIKLDDLPFEFAEGRCVGNIG